MSVTLRKKKISNGRTSLYLDIYFNGSRHYETLNLYLKKDSLENKETIRLAQKIVSKKQTEILSYAHGFIPDFNKKVNFVDYLEKISKTKNQKYNVWSSALIHVKNFSKDSISISAINELWLEQFQAYLLTKVKTNTAKTYFNKVKCALNAALKEKIIQQNPVNHIQQIKNEETQRTFLFIEEVQKLANTTCNDTNAKEAFLFACFTGLRFSDVEALTWENIQGETIEFRQKKTKGVEYMPLSDMAKNILKQVAIKKGVAVLPMKTNKIFTLRHKSNVNKSLSQWAKDAGITKHISFHTSRHTYATLLLTNGVDLYTVSKLMGHKDIKTTQIYAKIIDAKKQDAVNRLPIFEIAV